METGKEHKIDETPIAYTFNTAAFKLGRTLSTVRRLVKDGFLEAVWIAGQQQSSHEELMRFARSGDGVPSGRGRNATEAIKTRWHGKPRRAEGNDTHRQSSGSQHL